MFWLRIQRDPSILILRAWTLSGSVAFSFVFLCIIFFEPVRSLIHSRASELFDSWFVDLWSVELWLRFGSDICGFLGFVGMFGAYTGLSILYCFPGSLRITILLFTPRNTACWRDFWNICCSSFKAELLVSCQALSCVLPSRAVLHVCFGPLDLWIILVRARASIVSDILHVL